MKPLVYFLIFSAMSACGEEVRPLGHGELELTWQVSPRGCADANVTSVEVTAAGPETRTEIYECARGEARLMDLTAGTYTVTVEGLDAQGVARFTSPDTRVTVHPDLTASNPHARLVAKPAEAHVAWRFEDGRVCGAHGVESLSIAAFDKFDYEVAVVEARCDEAGAVIADILAGTYLIQVSGRGNDGLWLGQSTIALERGEAASVDVVLAEQSP